MNYLFCLLLCRQIALVLPYQVTNCGVSTVTCEFPRMHDPFLSVVRVFSYFFNLVTMLISFFCEHGSVKFLFFRHISI
jgi:hypothetical protein